jgi:apolipoprotein N-acyltransferase
VGGATPARGGGSASGSTSARSSPALYWIYNGVHILAGARVDRAVPDVGLAVDHGGCITRCSAVLVARWLPAGGAMRWLVALPARLGVHRMVARLVPLGFAWLSLGYSQTDTWLANLRPIIGIYGSARCCS